MYLDLVLGRKDYSVLNVNQGGAPGTKECIFLHMLHIFLSS